MILSPANYRLPVEIVFCKNKQNSDAKQKEVELKQGYIE